MLISMTMSAAGGPPSPLPVLSAAVTRVDLAVESLKSAILSGQLKPGQALVERKIAEQLGVSKTPVREALIVLERSGLLTMTSRGIAVRKLSFTDVRHVYEQRLLLEPWAIVDAARTDRNFWAAEQALADARRQADAGNRAGRAMANRRFHRGMYASSENSFVIGALDGLQDLTALAVADLLWEKWPTGDVEALEHQAIYEAASGGDADTAADLMRAHIYSSIDRAVHEESNAG